MVQENFKQGKGMKKLILFILILPSVLISQDISKLKMKDVNGSEFIMKKHLDNDATIVLFWATWCIPCKKEFPEIQKLQQKYQQKNVKVITISQDNPRSLAKVKSFVKSHDYDFTYLLDANGEVSSKFLINSVPYLMLVDTTGTVIYSHSGYRKGDEQQLEKEMLNYWSQRKNPKHDRTTK